jgi:hypothetical protein
LSPAQHADKLIFDGLKGQLASIIMGVSLLRCRSFILA